MIRFESDYLEGAYVRIMNHYWNDTTHEHMVQPGLVYVAHLSENATTYSKYELEKLTNSAENVVCHYLWMELDYGMGWLQKKTIFSKRYCKTY